MLSPLPAKKVAKVSILFSPDSDGRGAQALSASEAPFSNKTESKGLKAVSTVLRPAKKVARKAAVLESKEQIDDAEEETDEEPAHENNEDVNERAEEQTGYHAEGGASEETSGQANEAEGQSEEAKPQDSHELLEEVPLVVNADTGGQGGRESDDSETNTNTESLHVESTLCSLQALLGKC
jgi:hypothetical protein